MAAVFMAHHYNNKELPLARSGYKLRALTRKIRKSARSMGGAGLATPRSGRSAFNKVASFALGGGADQSRQATRPMVTIPKKPPARGTRSLK